MLSTVRCAHTLLTPQIPKTVSRLQTFSPWSRVAGLGRQVLPPPSYHILILRMCVHVCEDENIDSPCVHIGGRETVRGILHALSTAVNTTNT